MAVPEPTAEQRQKTSARATWPVVTGGVDWPPSGLDRWVAEVVGDDDGVVRRTAAAQFLRAWPGYGSAHGAAPTAAHGVDERCSVGVLSGKQRHQLPEATG
jgi:hypothetical protein